MKRAVQVGHTCSLGIADSGDIGHSQKERTREEEARERVYGTFVFKGKQPSRVFRYIFSFVTWLVGVNINYLQFFFLRG